MGLTLWRRDHDDLRWRSSVFKKAQSCYSKGVIIKPEKNPKLNINTLLET